MAQIKYVGPGPDTLEIAPAGVTVTLGSVVDVPDDVAELLLQRPDFEPAGRRTASSDTKEGD